MKSAVPTLFLTRGNFLAYTKSSSRVERNTWIRDNYVYPTPQVDTQGSAVVLSKSKTGDYLPTWKQRILNGTSATTTFDGVIQESTVKPGYMKVSFWHPTGQARDLQRPAWFSINGEFLPYRAVTFAAGGDLTSANNQALTLLMQKVRATNSHFMGGVFLGELREVVRMIASPARTLREGIGDYFSTLRKRKGRAPKHRLKQILADTWLEYSFGWQPLISDVKAGAEALARWDLEGEGILNRRSRIRAFARTEQLWGTPPPAEEVDNNYCYYTRYSRNVGSSTVIYTVGMEYNATAPVGSARRLAELSGFNLSDFVPTVWELIPWSFVVDYFSNVGDIIAYSCTDTSNMSWKQKTIVTSFKEEVHTVADHKKVIAAIPKQDLISIEGDSLGSQTSTLSSVSRVSLSALDYPQLQFTYPGASTKWINLLALTQSGRSLTPYRK